MKLKQMGETGLKVSELCLGTLTFGKSDWGCTEEDAIQIINHFAECAGNFIDTADIYGKGVSEEIVGRALRGRRQEFVIATKVGGPTGPGPNEFGLSRRHVLAAVEQSLRRLQTDWIDLYQVHAYDPSTPLEETMAALDSCLRSGKVRYLGCCNFSAWQIIKANSLAREMNVSRFCCFQPQYSLTCRQIEREHLPLCREERIGVMPWGTLGGGGLAGKVGKTQMPPPASRLALDPTLRAHFEKAQNLKIVETVSTIAAETGHTPAQIALGWVREQPGITAPIFGVRNLEQLYENLSATTVLLDDSMLNRLDEASSLEPLYPYDMHRQISDIIASKLLPKER